MPVSPTEQSIIERVPPQSQLMDRLAALVEQNSFTDNKAGVDKVGAWCEAALEGAGFRVGVMVTGVGGRHLIARRPGGGSRKLLLIGHLDTVYPQDSAFQKFLRADGDPDRAVGPGVADMKGGLVVLLAALEALQASGRLEDACISVVLNADEEKGSPDSTEIIRLEAEEAKLALVFECGFAREEGASTIVTARRGVGRMVLRATGPGGHAGLEGPRAGSAVLELAQKAVEIAALHDPDRRVSVNVGTFHGGSAANVLAAEAEMTVDYRFPDKQTGDDLGDAIIEIASDAHQRGPTGRPLIRTVCKEHLIRPALERTEAVAAAAEAVILAGNDLGLKLVEESRGGSSDAVLAFDAGCPAVCGLGAVGGEIHSDREWVSLRSLRERAQLAALVIDRFLRA